MTPSSPFHPPGSHPLSFVSYSNNPGVIGEPPGSRRQTPEPAPPPAGNGDVLLQLLQRGTGVHNSVADGRQSSQHPLASQQHGIGGADDASASWLLDPALASLGPSHPYHQQLLLQQQQQQQGIVTGGDILHSALLKQQSLATAQQLNLHQQFQSQQRPYVNQFAAGQANLGRPQLFQQQQPSLDRTFTGASIFPPIQAPLPAPQGVPSFSSRYPVVHSDQQRSLEQSWQSPQQGRQPSTDTVNGGSGGTWGASQSSAQQHQVQQQRQPQPHLYGNGVDLLQLLLGNTGGAQRSSSPSPSLRVGVDTGVDGKPPQKLSSVVVHGPIGPPKRNDSAASSEQEDLLGRFWAAPTAAYDLVSKSGVHQDDHFGHDLILDRPLMKEKLLHVGEARQPAEHHSLDLRLLGLNMPSLPESEPPGFSYPPGIRSSSSLSERSESKDRPYVGAWGGAGKGRIVAERDHTGLSQLQRVIGGQPPSQGRLREEIYLNSLRSSDISVATGVHPDPQDHTLKDWLFENEFSRESVRDPSRGGRRGASSAGRADSSRRGGRAASGQWVAVNDRQREKEIENIHTSAAGFRDQIENMDRGPSMSGSLLMSRDESKLRAEEGAPQKTREDIKRRRGHQQEWRMKQPAQSPSHGYGPSDAQAVDSLATARSAKELEGCERSVASLLPFQAPSLASQLDHPGLPVSSLSSSTTGTALEESLQNLHAGEDRPQENEFQQVLVGTENDDELGKEEEEELLREFSYLDMDDPDVSVADNSVHLQAAAISEPGTDLRRSAEHVSHHQRVNMRPDSQYRPDVEKISAKLLSIYEGLIPLEDEENRRRQFLSHLEDLVAQDWPGVRLFLFGSCANAFGVCNSDIDICLSINDDQSSKAELVTRMANILRMHNMHNVQALTHARVPIVKFTDPVTGISCDICVNNMLAVVNSKLLHDYSQVDIRLRQLAFIVKHWAKRRQVNETYRGTLSSYAYVLMCIHFLQQRKPAILPCLQGMPATYEVKIGRIECAYYNKVETLKNFGSQNKETVGELVIAFFEYWAFKHDYNRAVISVRTGSVLSKEQKDWTRRIGNERHLICIEDPFEVTHDLGRVVDRHSIRVLRDEFHRAAKILRHDPSSCATLFEPFIREK